MPTSTIGITGISGVFLYAKDPKALAQWYSKYFGFEFNFWEEPKSYGLEFIHNEARIRHAAHGGSTVFAIHPAKKHPPTGKAALRLQFRTDGLDEFVGSLKAGGVKIKKTDHFPHGNFAQLRDPEGNLIELFEPL